jgi:hypothetical protein
MSDIKGSIKITEKEIVIKSENVVEVYVKKTNLDCKSWIKYKGEIWQLKEQELEDDKLLDD